MEEITQPYWVRVSRFIQWEDEFRACQIRRWLRDDNKSLRTEEGGMTKDMKYPEEIKEEEWKRLIAEFEKKKEEEYCECHTKCPKCGKKYKRPYHYSDVKE